SPLRYKCKSSELGQEMVSTIMKARKQLGPDVVDKRGYLVLETEARWPISELSQLLRASTSPEDTDIRGFTFERGASDFMHAYIDGEAPRIFADLRDTFSTPTDPISGFQQWVENPPDRVAYLVCPPLKEHAINNLLDAGIRSSSRPPLPGFNELYWYVSFEANTPAPLHVEDGGAGSANLLVGGADKHWLVIHRSSASKLEKCVRKEFRQPKPCSQFVRHYNLILSPSWLEERGISYEIVTHRAGEMLVTLPGLTYHQVCNTGCNFAVAIN
ncbi:JmjC-domain-containing protein, partial [Pyrenochaeta sp. DS3sAY3a]